LYMRRHDEKFKNEKCADTALPASDIKMCQ
jgi:hypothetical protein